MAFKLDSVVPWGRTMDNRNAQSLQGNQNISNSGFGYGLRSLLLLKSSMWHLDLFVRKGL